MCQIWVFFSFFGFKPRNPEIVGFLRERAPRSFQNTNRDLISPHRAHRATGDVRAAGDRRAAGNAGGRDTARGWCVRLVVSPGREVKDIHRCIWRLAAETAKSLARQQAHHQEKSRVKGRCAAISSYKRETSRATVIMTRQWMRNRRKHAEKRVREWAGSLGKKAAQRAKRAAVCVNRAERRKNWLKNRFESTACDGFSPQRVNTRTRAGGSAGGARGTPRRRV